MVDPVFTWYSWNSIHYPKWNTDKHIVEHLFDVYGKFANWMRHLCETFHNELSKGPGAFKISIIYIDFNKNSYWNCQNKFPVYTTHTSLFYQRWKIAVINLTLAHLPKTRWSESIIWMAHNLSVKPIADVATYSKRQFLPQGYIDLK